MSDNALVFELASAGLLIGLGYWLLATGTADAGLLTAGCLVAACSLLFRSTRPTGH